MPLYLKHGTGKILKVSGKLAKDAACCCVTSPTCNCCVAGTPPVRFQLVVNSGPLAGTYIVTIDPPSIATNCIWRLEGLSLCAGRYANVFFEISCFPGYLALDAKFGTAPGFPTPGCSAYHLLVPTASFPVDCSTGWVLPAIDETSLGCADYCYPGFGPVPSHMGSTMTVTAIP